MEALAPSIEPMIYGSCGWTMTQWWAPHINGYLEDTTRFWKHNPSTSLPTWRTADEKVLCGRADRTAADGSHCLKQPQMLKSCGRECRSVSTFIYFHKNAVGVSTTFIKSKFDCPSPKGEQSSPIVLAGHKGLVSSEASLQQSIEEIVVHGYHEIS